ncbi:hypothetical protein A3Q56_08002, partial [Intoshia linei]
CHQSCKSCIKINNNCISCNTDKFLNARNQCLPCHKSCKKCNGPFDNNCTHCDEYRYLNNDNQCAFCDTNGHIIIRDDETRYGECEICEDNEHLVILIEDKRIGYCLCLITFSFINSLIDCTEHQFLTITDDLIRKECHPSCKTCNTTLATNCLSCIGTKYLSQNSDCRPCENGHIIRNADPQLQSCQGNNL